MSAQKRESTIPGRKHKVTVVDFGNPYLRNYLAHEYLEAHRKCLDGVRAGLPGWVARARARARAPLAAVLDIDEVVLGNIHMNEHEGFHAADYFAAPDGSPWPRGSRLNPLLPGARELLAALRGQGVEVFFVTGRLEGAREETLENFGRVGLPRPDAAHLVMCPPDEYPAPGASMRPYKEERRRRIAETHHIVLNLGDQVSDLGRYGDVQALCAQPFYYTP